jgi:hypothetical protein
VTCGSGATCKYFYVLDGRGNVVAPVDRYSYDVWGVPTISVENARQPLLYDGEIRSATASARAADICSASINRRRVIAQEACQPRLKFGDLTLGFDAFISLCCFAALRL